MIWLDFHGSTHGHFLEYVSNIWIMKTPSGSKNIFHPETGSAHSTDLEYKNNRIIKCGHFSTSKVFTPDPTDQIIQINFEHTNDRDFFIGMTNAIYKAADVGFERHINTAPPDVLKSPAKHRNLWYSRINERDNYFQIYGELKAWDEPMHTFAFRSFFNLVEFFKELNALAHFLNQTFVPDDSLEDIWKTFISRNQGLQSYNKCQHILESIISNADTPIQCTPIEEGWINFNLSKMFRLYDGILFESDAYPTSTKEISNIVKEHLLSL